MRAENGNILPSPSDLTAYLACEHLTTLDFRVARGDLVTAEPPEQAQLLFEKGLARGEFVAGGNRAVAALGALDFHGRHFLVKIAPRRSRVVVGPAHPPAKVTLIRSFPSSRVRLPQISRRRDAAGWDPMAPDIWAR